MCPKCASTLNMMDLRAMAFLARESITKWTRIKELASKSDLTPEERAELPDDMRNYNEPYMNQMVPYMQSKIEQAERIHTYVQELIKNVDEQPLTRHC